MDIISYKGYQIHAVPHCLADTGEWAININIFHDTGDETPSKSYSAANTYKTREEAVAYCFNYGKQIIDRNFANLENA